VRGELAAVIATREGEFASGCARGPAARAARRCWRIPPRASLQPSGVERQLQLQRQFRTPYILHP